MYRGRRGGVGIGVGKARRRVNSPGVGYDETTVTVQGMLVTGERVVDRTSL